MLTNIHVKNMALIDEADIDLFGGLNILTGETGAGKSIIIGSVNIALGSRVTPDIIREGSDYALTELSFHIDDKEKLKKLKDMDVEDLDEGDILIARKITPVKSTIKVNGQTFTLSQVKKIASILIDIHGQRDNMNLIDESRHLQVIDSFYDEKINAVKEELKEYIKEYEIIKTKFDELNIDESEALREKSFLEYEINEIEGMNLVEGEDERLEDEYKKITNLYFITEKLNSAYSLLSGLDINCIDSLGNAIKDIVNASEYDETISSIGQILSDSQDLISDGARQIADYIENNEFDQKMFNDTEYRLDAINSIKNKYNCGITEIILLLEKKKARLDELENFNETLEKLKHEVASILKKINNKCETLTNLRKENAMSLCQGIREALLDLNFNSVQFDAEFKKLDSFSYDGNDTVRFMISTNAGEKLKPLSKIASGGEMSRIMLAIKTVAAGKEDTDTLIFDEIDSGISGRTAQMVAEKLDKLSERHQIICITHLPQIASMADNHYVINKIVDNLHTRTEINKLSYDESVMELARLLGGTKITDTVVSNAKEMKSMAKIR